VYNVKVMPDVTPPKYQPKKPLERAKSKSTAPSMSDYLSSASYETITKAQLETAYSLAFQYATTYSTATVGSSFALGSVNPSMYYGVMTEPLVTPSLSPATLKITTEQKKQNLMSTTVEEFLDSWI
jgi:hypothetical protein